LQKERRYVTASELAEKVHVSKKTIYRDIQEISENNPSHCRIIKKENNGYSIEFYEESKWNAHDDFEHREERRLNLLLFLLSIAL
jgi:transcriptional antiterminator